jgi:hypothetical protein
MIAVEIQGLDELKKRLDTKRFAAASKIAIGRAANEVKIVAIPYPPAGPWCQPGPYPHRWYQRLFGPRWARKYGATPGGRDTDRARWGGPIQEKWAVTVQDDWTAKIWNDAKYGPWVKGEEQTPVHKAHGWTKLSDDAKGLADKGVFTRVFAEEIEKVLGGG